MNNIALSFQKEICNYIKSREEDKIVNLLFKEDKKKNSIDEKQAIAIQIKALLIESPQVNNADMEKIYAKKNENKEFVSELEFSENKLKEIISIYPNKNDLILQRIVSLYERKRIEIENEHKPEAWLDKYSECAKGVKFATHVPKLSHSSINGVSSFYVQKTQDVGNNEKYLCTDRLDGLFVDTAIDNAANTPVATLLKLEVEGESIASFLANNDSLPFSLLSQDNTKVDKWVERYSSVLKTDELGSHSLIKQIYFPVNQVGKYHLLCNLSSSSMAHAIHLFLQNLPDKKTNKLMEKNKFSDNELTSVPGKAKLAITSLDGAKNVSPLNSKRGGKVSLLSCLPPTWKSQLKPPVYKKSLFFVPSVYFQTKEDIEYLRDFLLRFQNLDLSIKNPERKRWVERWVGNIIDEVFFYVASIQELEPGWSANIDIRLTSAHQYLLDPYRDDGEFQAARASTDWQEVVCADFAHWLNRKLAGADAQFTPQAEHTRLWHKLFEPELRIFIEELELIKQHDLGVQI